MGYDVQVAFVLPVGNFGKAHAVVGCFEADLGHEHKLFVPPSVASCQGIDLLVVGEVFARNGGGIPALDSPVTAVMPEDSFSGDEVAVPLVERMGIVHAEGVLCQAQAVDGNGFADGGICPVEADLAVGVVVGVVLDAVGGGQHPVGLVVEGLLVVEGGFEGIVLQNVAVFSIQFLDGLTGDVGDAGVLVDVYFFFVEGVFPDRVSKLRSLRS